MGQPRPQFLQTEAQSAFDRAQRNTILRRNLLMGQALEIGEFDRLALILG